MSKLQSLWLFLDNHDLITRKYFCSFLLFCDCGILRGMKMLLYRDCYMRFLGDIPNLFLSIIYFRNGMQLMNLQVLPCLFSKQVLPIIYGSWKLRMCMAPSLLILASSLYRNYDTVFSDAAKISVRGKHYSGSGVEGVARKF